MKRSTIYCFHQVGTGSDKVWRLGEVYGQRLPTSVMISLLRPYSVSTGVDDLRDAEFEEMIDDEFSSSSPGSGWDL